MVRSVPSAGMLGSVEVQKSEGASTWYCGHVVDVGNKETLVVAFEGGVWPKAEYPFSRARKSPAPPKEGAPQFHPKVGEEVELLIEATEHAPAAWVAATVKKTKHEFFYVNRTGSAAGGGEFIVEKERLRPPCRAQSLAAQGLSQDTFKLPAGLEGWVSTQDALGCFSHIEDQANLSFIQVAKNSLKLFGDPKAIARAKMILEVHVKHQAIIQDFQDKRERDLKALETKRNRIEGTGYKHSAEVMVDPAFISRIIGKQGKAIKALQEKYDVNVRIPPEGEEEKPVKIFGNSAENVEKARLEIEFVEEVIEIDPDMISWILGRNGRTIQTFKESCNLVSCKMAQEGGGKKLRLCGTRHAVQEGVAMFETHIMYYPVFRQMDEEMWEIISNLEEYGDYNAKNEWAWYRDAEENGGGTYGKGKGASWGKGDKGDRGGGKGKDWEEQEKGRSKGDGKRESRDAGKDSHGKENGKAGKGGKEAKGKSKGRRDAADDDSEDDDDHASESEAWGAAGKGKGKSGKGGKAGKGRTWAKVESESGSGSGNEDNGASKGGRKGRGRGAPVGRGGDRAAGASEAESGGKQGGRRMGRKGVRS